MASTGVEAIDVARRFLPHVVILGIMMPGMDALEVLRHLRASGDSVPVIFLTSRDEHAS